MTERLRSDDLQETAIERVRDAVIVDDEHVIRTAVAADRDDLDPRITVGATVTTTPNNRLEQAEGTIRVSVDATREYVLEAAKGEAPRLKTLLADIVDELTSHTAGLYAAGVASEEDVAYEESLNRYVGAIEVGVERNTAER